MMTGTETNRENLTLTGAALAACRPMVGEGGHVLRALCPFHGSDRQRSLRVQVHSGRFVCFTCGAVRDHRVGTRGRRRSWRLVSLSPRIFLWTQSPTSAINVHQFDPV